MGGHAYDVRAAVLPFCPVQHQSDSGAAMGVPGAAANINTDCKFAAGFWSKVVDSDKTLWIMEGVGRFKLVNPVAETGKKSQPLISHRRDGVDPHLAIDPHK